MAFPIVIDADLLHRLTLCLACGRQKAPCLVRAGSPRCHDCRASNAPLRAELVEQA